MLKAKNSRVQTDENKNGRIFPNIKFRLRLPPIFPEGDPAEKKIGPASSSFKRPDFQNPHSKGRLKFQCHYEERKRRAEMRRRKILQKLKRVYKINAEGLNEHVTNEIIMRVELMEKEKREREKRNLERTVVMINRLLEDQKYKRRGLKPPSWRKPTATNAFATDLVSIDEEEISKKKHDSLPGEFSGSVTSGEKVRIKVENLGMGDASRGPPTEPLQGEEKEEEGQVAKLPKCVERKKSDTVPLKTSVRALLKGSRPSPLECSLESTPKKVVFQDYMKGKVHLQDLKITNVGLETIHCRYLGIVVHGKSEERFPIGVAVRDSVKLRPGLSCSTKIRLCSDDDSKQLECSIVYETRRQQKPLQHALFFVHVFCLPARAVIKISPLKLAFPSLTWCAATGPEGQKQLMRVLRIENTGAKSCSCRISKAIPPVVCPDEEFCREQEEEGEIGTPPRLEISPSTVSRSQSGELYYGEDNFSSEEAEEEARALLEELLENVFAAFRFSMMYHLEIPPFSVQLIPVRFIPQYKGFHHELYSVQFTGCYNLDEETVEVTGLIKQLPIRAEPEVIDLKTCVANSGVYSSTFRIYNESKGPYSVVVKIPSCIRNHAHVYPRATTIQPLTWFDFSLRMYPRVTLSRDSSRYFTEDSQVLEFPIFVHPTNVGSCKRDYIKLYVFAVITDYCLELSPPEIDFGTVTTLETVSAELQLTNHSLAIQEFGFLNLPKGVRVEPNMGFGRILPKETIPLYLLYSPGPEEGETPRWFDVRVTSIAEQGGFKEKLEPEESVECLNIWGEDYGYDYMTPKPSSPSKISEEALPEEESEEYSSCEEASSIEGEELSREIRLREIKIRAFLRQDREKASEDSFFKKMNPEPKDYEPQQSDGSLAKVQPRGSQSYVGETEESEDSLEGRPSRPEFQSVKCRANVIVPRCQISESVIQLPATPCSSFCLYRFRLNGMNESIDADCVCGLRSTVKKSHLCEGKPKFEGSFEFQYFCPHIKLEPQSGYFKAGDSLPVTIVYRPEFPAEQLRHDSRILKEDKREKSVSAAKLNAAPKPTTTGKKSSEGIQGGDIDEIINISLYELDKYDLFAGERSLQELINPFYVETRIQCLVKTIACGETDVKTEVHELLLICPAIKPNFIYLGNCQEISFKQVFAGTRPKKLVEVQNISFQRVSPVISLLNPIGPFSCPAGFRRVEVDPEHIWRQPLTFAPVAATDSIEKEYFEIHCGPTNIFLVATGQAIEPQYKLTPNFVCCLLRTKPDTQEELKLEVENLSPITLKLQLREEFVKEGVDAQVDAAEEAKDGKEKPNQPEESKEKKKSKNTETDLRNCRFLDEIPENVSQELENFAELKEKVFTVVGYEGDDQVSVVPQGKAALKIRFTPPANINNKEYAVKYQLLLEKLCPLKEILLVATVSKGS